MGGVFSAPANAEEHHHHHHEHEEVQPENTQPVQQKAPSQRPRKKVNKAFIPETIDDPAEGEPCGLYVDGVNYNWDKEKFSKYLTKLGIKFTKAFTKKSMHTGFIYFDNNEDRADAYKILIGQADGGRQFFIVGLSRDHDYAKKQCDKLRARATSDLDTRDIDNKVAPWNSIPYDEQIRRKSEKFTQIIEPIIPEGSKNITVYPAPKIAEYRNKVELTIGRDLNDEICVGFNLGSRLQDVVAPIKSNVNCPKGTAELAEKLREFIVQSGIPVFDRIKNVGKWKYALIRSNESDEIMLMIVVYGSIGEDGINSFKAAFENEVDSLYYCETDTFEGYGKEPKITLLSGKAILMETLRGLQFEISPLSFFQTNTQGAELLFQKVEELAEIDQDTVLLDVCCGTGVIGLSMAKKAKFVVGVDIEEQAILDARRNAEINGITNAEFIADKAEVAMPKILEKYAVNNQKVVAIVDPPRGGLQKKALTALRNCKNLNRLVYISCNADSLVQNAQKVLYKNYPEQSTQPFHPVNWFGVDMFPHTDRCEIVMLMERE